MQSVQAPSWCLVGIITFVFIELDCLNSRRVTSTNDTFIAALCHVSWSLLYAHNTSVTQSIFKTISILHGLAHVVKGCSVICSNSMTFSYIGHSIAD